MPYRSITTDASEHGSTAHSNRPVDVAFIVSCQYCNPGIVRQVEAIDRWLAHVDFALANMPGRQERANRRAGRLRRQFSITVRRGYYEFI